MPWRVHGAWDERAWTAGPPSLHPSLPGPGVLFAAVTDQVWGKYPPPSEGPLWLQQGGSRALPGPLFGLGNVYFLPGSHPTIQRRCLGRLWPGFGTMMCLVGGRGLVRTYEVAGLRGKLRRGGEVEQKGILPKEARKDAGNGDNCGCP